MADVEFAARGAVGTITFNRPEQRNAMSLDMRQIVRRHLNACADDPAIRCIVVEGAGGHFMGGSDVRDFARVLDEMEPEARRRYFEDRVTGLAPLTDAFRSHPRPIVAKVRGACAGLGLGIVVACDFVYAADTAFFSAAYVHLGASPDGGLTHELPRLLGPRRATAMLMLGERLAAPDAVAAGLINAALPEAELDAEVERVAERLSAAPTFAIGLTKELLASSGTRPIEAQMAREVSAFARCAVSADFAEGVKAFTEKRRAVFSGR